MTYYHYYINQSLLSWNLVDPNNDDNICIIESLGMHNISIDNIIDMQTLLRIITVS